MNGIGSDQADKIVQLWISELTHRNMYIHPKTSELIRFTVMNMNEEGYLLFTLGKLSEQLNVHSSAVRTILVKLEIAGLVFRRRGLIGVHDLDSIKKIVEEG